MDSLTIRWIGDHERRTHEWLEKLQGVVWLSDLVNWTGKRKLSVEAIQQDEFTHDVVVTDNEQNHLVFDTT